MRKILEDGGRLAVSKKQQQQQQQKKSKKMPATKATQLTQLTKSVYWICKYSQRCVILIPT